MLIQSHFKLPLDPQPTRSKSPIQLVLSDRVPGLPSVRPGLRQLQEYVGVHHNALHLCLGCSILHSPPPYTQMQDSVMQLFIKGSKMKNGNVVQFSSPSVKQRNYVRSCSAGSPLLPKSGTEYCSLSPLLGESPHFWKLVCLQCCPPFTLAPT